MKCIKSFFMYAFVVVAHFALSACTIQIMRPATLVGGVTESHNGNNAESVIPAGPPARTLYKSWSICQPSSDYPGFYEKLYFVFSPEGTQTKVNRNVYAFGNETCSGPPVSPRATELSAILLGSGTPSLSGNKLLKTSLSLTNLPFSKPEGYSAFMFGDSVMLYFVSEDGNKLYLMGASCSGEDPCPTPTSWDDLVTGYNLSATIHTPAAWDVEFDQGTPEPILTGGIASLGGNFTPMGSGARNVETAWSVCLSAGMGSSRYTLYFFDQTWYENQMTDYASNDCTGDVLQDVVYEAKAAFLTSSDLPDIPVGYLPLQVSFPPAGDSVSYKASLVYIKPDGSQLCIYNNSLEYYIDLSTETAPATWNDWKAKTHSSEYDLDNPTQYLCLDRVK